MSRKDYIDRIYNLTSTEHDDALLDMRIDFSDKYLPSDREDTQRRYATVKRRLSVSIVLIFVPPIFIQLRL